MTSRERAVNCWSDRQIGADVQHIIARIAAAIDAAVAEERETARRPNSHLTCHLEENGVVIASFANVADMELFRDCRGGRDADPEQAVQ